MKPGQKALLATGSVILLVVGFVFRSCMKQAVPDASGSRRNETHAGRGPSASQAFELAGTAKPESAQTLAAQGGPRLVTVDVALTDPIVEEESGLFSKLYNAWNEEAEDRTATEDAHSFLETAFSHLGIRPESAYVRCGELLCRARFRFEELKELYRMQEIEEPDGIRVATTFPQNEGRWQTVSIYWARTEHPEGPLTETLGRVSDTESRAASTE